MNDDDKKVNGPWFHTRIRHALSEMGVVTLGDLKQITAADLLARKNFGLISLMSVQNYMKSLGEKLRPGSAVSDDMLPPKDWDGTLI